MSESSRQAPAIRGFTYVEHIGSGGFADVFLYEQHLPSRKVAVKVLHEPAVEGAGLAQFHAEANVMAQLSGHQAIVAIHDADVSDDGRPYLVMEYCPPPTLASRYRTERIGISEALETGIRIASALETVHRAGLLHRDVKPHNILTSAFGAAKLTDFGIAGSTGDDQVYGMSVPWSPPESFLETPPADARVDVYALAATVYSLLAGRSPFEVPGGANDNATLMSRIERQALAPLARADVPDSLNRALARGMAKRLEARHPTALDLARDLQDVQVELGLPQTRVEVFDATPGGAHVEDADQRTSIKPVSIIIPEALGAGTLLAPRVISPADAQTIAKPAAGHPTAGVLAPPAQAVAPSATTGAAATEPSVGVRPDVAESPVETPRRGVLVGAVLGAVVLVAGGGVVWALGSSEDETPDDAPAFGKTSQPTSAIAAYVPSPEGLKVTVRNGKVTFRWSNPDPLPGDEYGVEWTLDNAPQPQELVSEERFSARAAAGEIVCATVVLVRSNGAVSEPTTQQCEGV